MPDSFEFEGLVENLTAILSPDSYNVPWFGTYWREGGLKIKFDWISAGLIILLAATLVAFFTGKFPYPYGWIVITILLVFRLTACEKKE